MPARLPLIEDRPRPSSVSGSRQMRNRPDRGGTGRYFWCSDGLVVRDAGISSMTEVLVRLVEKDEFTQVLQRLDT
ncbi:hypothetical protein ACFVT1_27235 [Streptomyces sp. NPDC057963]|uniref:hypothetical protein n=1 Tax=Streptomyces sp. NPDC057963 TaxID=3346290 RepID=UPI0036F0407F